MSLETHKIGTPPQPPPRPKIIFPISCKVLPARRESRTLPNHKVWFELQSKRYTVDLTGVVPTKVIRWSVTWGAILAVELIVQVMILCPLLQERLLRRGEINRRHRCFGLIAQQKAFECRKNQPRFGVSSEFRCRLFRYILAMAKETAIELNNMEVFPAIVESPSFTQDCIAMPCAFHSFLVGWGRDTFVYVVSHHPRQIYCCSPPGLVDGGI